MRIHQSVDSEVAQKPSFRPIIPSFPIDATELSVPIQLSPIL